MSKTLDIKQEELDALLERVKSNNLQEGDYELIKALAETVSYLSTLSDAFEAAEFAEGHVVLLGYTIQKDNPIIGKSLIELKGVIGVIVAIIREQKTIIPRGNDKIKGNDRIYFVIRKNDIAAIEK